MIVEPTRAAKHRPYAFAALSAFALVTFGFGLGRLALIGPDEPRYAEVAREMFASNDWISPRLCGCLWFEKPALLYWMEAACYSLFGVNEFAARAPSVLAAMAAMLFLYYAVSRAVSGGLALACALAFATFGLVVAYARVATPDICFASAMSIALLAGYLAAGAEGRRRTFLWALSFAGLGLAMLAKGLAAVALVAGIFAIYFVALRQPGFIRWREAIIGAAIFLGVAGLWYVPVTIKHGWPFIQEFFIRHHFQRYTSNTFGHPQPFYFFFAITIEGIAPWTFFLIPAAARLRALKPRESTRDSLLLFAWIWVAVPLLFFSFSGSKLPGYILPVFPALAVIIGNEIDRLITPEPGVRRARLSIIASWMTALLLACAGAGWLIYVARGHASGWQRVLVAMPPAASLAAAAALAARKTKLFVAGAAFMMLSLAVSASILVLPRLSDELTLKQLSLDAASELRPGERITFFIKKEFAPVFYAEGRVVCGTGDSDILNALSEDILAGALENESSLIVITTSNWRRGLESDPRFMTELIATQGDALAFRVSLKRFMAGGEAR